MRAYFKYLIASFFLIFLSIFLTGSTVHADTLGAIQDYPIPAGSNPVGIVEDTHGNIWFAQDVAKKIWKFVPSLYDASNPYAAFTSYDVSSSPNSIIVGPDDSVWFTLGSKVGKISAGGAKQEYSLPTETINGTQESYVSSAITMGPDARVWIFASNYSLGARTFTMNANGSIDKKMNLSNITGAEPIVASVDYENQRVWYGYRTYAYPAGYTTRVGYYTMPSSTTTEWVAPISSVMGGVVTIDGKFWIIGDINKLVDVNASGTFSSVYTLPVSYAGIWSVREGLDGYMWATLSNEGKLVRVDQAGNMQNIFLSSTLTGGSGTYGARPIGLATGSDGNMWFTQYGNNRIGKIGTGVNGNTADDDNDGLTKSQELQQGTSDQTSDTDSDGLSDYTESEWNVSRTTTFCGSSICDYPRPLQKDVYIEIDWMQGYEVSQLQLVSIRDAFAAKGIRAHFDTGQLGGGNEVPYNNTINFLPTVGSTDFYDYKNGGNGITPQFDGTNRSRIWRYMIMGNSYGEDPESSGASFTGDDDAFIAYGLIQNNQSGFGYSNFDTALAGTIIHELGHNLCLSGTSSYTGHDASCVYSGIDTTGSTDYVSSMSYLYQMFEINYSSGINGEPNDHNDWSALDYGIGDFADPSRNTGDEYAHGKKLKTGVNLQEAKKVKNDRKKKGIAD